MLVNKNNEETEKKMNVMIYMGPYLKRREYGTYNDCVTDEQDLNADYKSYINLKTGDVYNIDFDRCKEFEMKNIILRPLIIFNNYDTYLSHYMEILTYFHEQTKSGREEEEVIKELRDKYEKKIEIEKLKSTRENLKNLELELSKIEETRGNILGKIERVCNSCSHDVVVKTQKNDLEDTHFDRAICLICNQKYSSPVFYKFDNEFKNIIHFESEKFNNLTEEEKVDLAFNMFEEERKNNPDISDSKIVEIINDRLKNEKGYIKGKVLSNKPDALN